MTAHRDCGDQADSAEARPRSRARQVRGPRGAKPGPVVKLTRFAAQNLYAPLRTVEPLPGVMRANLRRDLDLGTLMPTLAGARGRALASWRLEDQWVTAVRLTNTSADWVALDRACCKAISSPPPSSTGAGPRGTRGHDRPVPGDARARLRAVAAAGDSPLRPCRASAAAGRRPERRGGPPCAVTACSSG